MKVAIKNQNSESQQRATEKPLIIVDWLAATWAGLFAGSAFLLALLFIVPTFDGGNAWVIIRLLASPLLGPEVLAPPATFHKQALILTISAHVLVSLLATYLLALIVHRGGILSGMIGGAIFGAALYVINMYFVSYFFPWFFAMRSAAFFGAYVLFGFLAGTLYEVLESEIHERLQGEA